MSGHDQRDDARYGEDVCIGFAMYCDTRGLSLAEGQELAERLIDSLLYTAEERSDYLTAEAAPG